MKVKVLICTFAAAVCLGLAGLYHGMAFSHDDLPVSVSYDREEGLLFTVEQPYVLRSVQAEHGLMDTSRMGVSTRSFRLPTAQFGTGTLEVLTLDCGQQDCNDPPVPMEFHIIGQTEDELLVETYQHSFLIDSTRYP